jgi:hypothetical protein
MQSTLNRRLSKVALALAVAGYCALPSAMAAGENKVQGAGPSSWQVSGSTGTIQGTKPWITRDADHVGDGTAADADKDHVTVTIDRGTRAATATTDGDKQFHIGDKVTINWAIGDTQRDLDDSNTATKGKIQWMSFSDQNGGDPKPIGTVGSDSYTITEADADRYIGVQMTPTTTTGDPNIGEVVTLKDLSTNAGGGANDDDIPEGPVVDDSINVAIYDTADATVNLLKNSAINLHTDHTYKAQLWKDTNKNGTYDNGEPVVTDQYDYIWVFTGSSKQGGTTGGDSTVQNQDLVIPTTNAQATSIFAGAGADGVQGYGLSIKYKHK